MFFEAEVKLVDPGHQRVAEGVAVHQAYLRIHRLVSQQVLSRRNRVDKHLAVRLHDVAHVAVVLWRIGEDLK